MIGPHRYESGEHKSCVLTGSRITEGPVRMFLLAPAPVSVGDRSRVMFSEYGGVGAMFVPFVLPLEGYYNGHHVKLDENEHTAFLTRRLGAPAQEVACLALHLSPPRAACAVDRVIARVSRYDPCLAWNGALKAALATQESWRRFGTCRVTPDLAQEVRNERAVYRRCRDLDRIFAKDIAANRQRSFWLIADTTPDEVIRAMVDETYNLRVGGSYTATAAPRSVPGGIAQTFCDGLLHVLVTAEGPRMPTTSFSLAPCNTRGGRQVCSNVGHEFAAQWTPDIYSALSGHRVSHRNALGRFEGGGLPGVSSPEMLRVYGEALTARFADLYAATAAFFGAMEAAGRRLTPSPSYGCACDPQSITTQVEVHRSGFLQTREERRAWLRR